MIGWLIFIAIIFGLPMLASFTIIPESADPNEVGQYFDGVIKYWISVINNIEGVIIR